MPESGSQGGLLRWEGAWSGGMSAPGGVSIPGGLLWGGAWSRGVYSGGVSALGGVSAPGGSALGGEGVPVLWGVCSGGVCSGVCVPGLGGYHHPPCEQNDKQVQKYYLGHNFVAAGNNDYS